MAMRHLVTLISFPYRVLHAAWIQSNGILKKAPECKEEWFDIER
jgi:hypothetical protein